MENQRQFEPMFDENTAATLEEDEKVVRIDSAVKPASESFQTPTSVADVVNVVDEEQLYRAGAYRILARLLRAAPDQQVLEQVSGFSQIESQGDELAMAMAMLGLSASSSNPIHVDDEYHELFIGLGRGELMPYGSWYLTGFLMEKPLGKLRDDLTDLGYQRKSEVHEPEDHAGALCDVMAMLISDAAPHQVQADFFNHHLGSWLERFFTDLSQANAAVFYKAVGRFGFAFISFEQKYLSMQV